jgi:hypothetical protein
VAKTTVSVIAKKNWTEMAFIDVFRYSGVYLFLRRDQCIGITVSHLGRDLEADMNELTK